MEYIEFVYPHRKEEHEVLEKLPYYGELDMNGNKAPKGYGCDFSSNPTVNVALEMSLKKS